MLRRCAACYAERGEQHDCGERDPFHNRDNFLAAQTLPEPTMARELAPSDGDEFSWIQLRRDECVTTIRSCFEVLFRVQLLWLFESNRTSASRAADRTCFRILLGRRNSGRSIVLDRSRTLALVLNLVKILSARSGARRLSS